MKKSLSVIALALGLGVSVVPSAVAHDLPPCSTHQTPTSQPEHPCVPQPGGPIVAPERTPLEACQINLAAWTDLGRQYLTEINELQHRVDHKNAVIKRLRERLHSH